MSAQPKFTRRHYKAIAAVIRERDQQARAGCARSVSLSSALYASGKAAGISQLAVTLAGEFLIDNPRFDEDRFFHAIATGEGL